jgi:hypothetical protein
MKTQPNEKIKVDPLCESVLRAERLLLEFRDKRTQPIVRMLRQLRAQRARNLRLRRRNGSRP